MSRGRWRGLVERREHVRALKVSREGWRVVFWLPSLCEVLGEDCPAWTLPLARHAAALRRATPAAVLDVLSSAAGQGDGAVVDDPEAVEIGEALDLCDVLGPAAGGGEEIVLTALGEVVVLGVFSLDIEAPERPE